MAAFGGSSTVGIALTSPADTLPNTQFGYDGLLLATLLAGAILIAAGLVRAGRFIALVPEPVIEGFTVGIALIIAVSQLTCWVCRLMFRRT